MLISQDVHIPTRCGSNSPNVPQLTTNFCVHERLDDFTAVVTATVLQSLPYLSKLNALLNTWSIRLAILREVPIFLSELEDATIAMKSAWHVIGSRGNISQQAKGSKDLVVNENITRDAFETMRGVLGDKVARLGRRLDWMLDTLEGREETLPDTWIDRIEDLESNFGQWYVEAEKRVLENELLAHPKEEKNSI